MLPRGSLKKRFSSSHTKLGRLPLPRIQAGIVFPSKARAYPCVTPFGTPRYGFVPSLARLYFKKAFQRQTPYLTYRQRKQRRKKNVRFMSESEIFVLQKLTQMKPSNFASKIFC
jgi:hypothetical protein